MKKTLVMIITIITVFALAACSKKEEPAAEPTAAVIQQEVKPEATPTEEPVAEPTLEAAAAATEENQNPAEEKPETDNSTDAAPAENEDKSENGELTLPDLNNDGDVIDIPVDGGDSEGTEASVNLFETAIMELFIGNGEFRIFTAEEQEQIKAEALEEDALVDFAEDGTITISQVSGDSIKMVANPDGSMYASFDGEEIFMSTNGDWPAEAAEAGIPEAPFTVSRSVVMGGNISIEFTDVDYQAAYDYGQMLKAAGFEYDEENGESNLKEAGMYGFTGKNADDRELVFYFMQDETESYCSLTLTDDIFDDDETEYDPDELVSADDDDEDAYIE